MEVETGEVQEMLESEKIKCKALTTEKNKLLGEHEALVRLTERLNKENAEDKESKAAMSEEIDELQRETRSCKRKLELSEETIVEIKRKGNLTEEKLKATEKANEANEQQISNLERQNAGNSREQMGLKKEISALKQDLIDRGNDLTSAKEKSVELGNESLRAQEDLESLKQQNKKLTKTVEAMKESSEEASFYVEKSKNLETEMSKMVTDISKAREEQVKTSQSNTELQLGIRRMEDSIANLNDDIGSKKEENSVLRETLISVKQAGSAKEEAIEAANNQIKVLQNGKKLLEDELESMRESTMEVNKMKRISESECTKLKRLNDSLHIDNEELKNRLQKLETELESLQAEATVGNEVAILRKQMSVMRNQMLDGEGGGGELDDYSYDLEDVDSPRKKRMNESKILEQKREKEAYETIISKLRDELSEEADKRRKIIADLSAAKKEAAVVATLESQISTHAATVQRLEDDLTSKEVEIQRAKRLEMNATALSAEYERSVNRSKDSNTSLTNDITELQNLVQQERIRSTKIERQLAQSEKRCAEFLASKVRAEAVSEGALQESGAKTRALINLREGEEVSKASVLSLVKSGNQK